MINLITIIIINEFVHQYSSKACTFNLSKHCLRVSTGLEGQLDELNHRWFNFLQERWLVLSKELRNISPAVYTKDKDWDDDPHRFFIFSNEETLKRICWQHFISDSEPLMADISTIKKQLEQEIIIAKSFLYENHQDIMNNFDPKVIKFRKKRKIIMSPEALNDLAKVVEEDEDAE